MKTRAKINLLKLIIKKLGVPKHYRRKVLAYLSVTFLQIKIKDVSRILKKSENKTRYVVTCCSIRLKENKSFMAWMHLIAKEYVKQSSYKIAS